MLPGDLLIVGQFNRLYFIGRRVKKDVLLVFVIRCAKSHLRPGPRMNSPNPVVSD